MHLFVGVLQRLETSCKIRGVLMPFLGRYKMTVARWLAASAETLAMVMTLVVLARCWQTPTEISAYFSPPSSGRHALEMAVAPRNQLSQCPTTSPSATLLLGAITVAR